MKWYIYIYIRCMQDNSPAALSTSAQHIASLHCFHPNPAPKSMKPSIPSPVETVGTFMKWQATQGRRGQTLKTKACKSADIVAQLAWHRSCSQGLRFSENRGYDFKILHLKLLDSTWCPIFCGPKLVSSLIWGLLGCWAMWWLRAWELQVG